jgi:hypothetical protein
MNKVINLVLVNKKAIVGFVVFLALQGLKSLGIITSDTFGEELTTVLEGLLIALSVWIASNKAQS